MDKYMLLFRTTPVTEDFYANMSPEAMQAELQKWNDWIGGLAARGRFESSEVLTPTGKLVSGSAMTITDGPFIEGKELVSGYMLYSAESMDEAIELSKGCPIYDLEGTVEIRKIHEYQ